MRAPAAEPPRARAGLVATAVVLTILLMLVGGVAAAKYYRSAGGTGGNPTSPAATSAARNDARMVDIPCRRLVGKSGRAAEQELVNLGFTTSVQKVDSGTPANSVVDVPCRAQYGSKVAITVSSGKTPAARTPPPAGNGAKPSTTPSPTKASTGPSISTAPSGSAKAPATCESGAIPPLLGGCEPGTRP
jgi:hypothetical protein